MKPIGRYNMDNSPAGETVVVLHLRGEADKGESATEEAFAVEVSGRFIEVYPTVEEAFRVLWREGFRSQAAALREESLLPEPPPPQDAEAEEEEEMPADVPEEVRLLRLASVSAPNAAAVPDVARITSGLAQQRIAHER